MDPFEDKTPSRHSATVSDAASVSDSASAAAAIPAPASVAAPGPPAPAPWLAPDWRPAVDAWIAEQVEAQGLRLDGAIELSHQRPWSTVLRLPVRPAGVGGPADAAAAALHLAAAAALHLAGDAAGHVAGDAAGEAGPDSLYFKAVLPALGQEIALTETLGRWHPESCLAPMAAARDRGWMLLPDGGQSLRQRLAQRPDVALWRDALWRYSILQRELVPRVDELLAMGAFDRRLALLPGQFARLLEDEKALLVGLPKGLTGDELAQLRSLQPRLVAMAEQLAAFGIPESLDHSDFHDGNIFAGPDGCRFFDWGEACISHPFFSLVVGLRSIASRLDLQKGGPEMAALRLVYLEPWSRYAPRRRLQSAADLAGRLGTVVRALNWHEVLCKLPDGPERAAEASSVPGWLKRFLQAETRRMAKAGQIRGGRAATKAARARKNLMAGATLARPEELAAPVAPEAETPPAARTERADPARPETPAAPSPKRATGPARAADPDRVHRAPKWRPVVRGAMRATAADEVDSRHPELPASFDYRWEHVKAVVRLALVLARLEGADPEVVEAAAWLHDVRKATGAEHGAEGAAFARTLLPATDFPAAKIEAVALAISDHVGLWRDSQLERLESRVLWDADKLTKLGLTSALHYTASALAGSKTRSSANLLARGRSSNWMARTVASMQTEPGRRAARRRLEAYRGFWDALDDELSGSDLV